MKNYGIIFSFLLIILLSSCQDTLTEPEEQFVQIHFKYGFRNELNTFENTYQKDLIMDGVVKVDFWFTAEEQTRIFVKARELNFFSMPDTFRNSPGDTILVRFDPNPGVQKLRIKYTEKDNSTVWEYPLNTHEHCSEFNDLLELQDYIQSVIENKPQYKRLPSPRGGYN